MTAGTRCSGDTYGANRSTCSTPFCSTTTRVSSRRSAGSHVAAAAASYALVVMSTQSTGVACAGAVMMRGAEVIVPVGVSTSRWSKVLRAHTVTAMSGFWPSHAARMPPMAPGPMMATVVMPERSPSPKTGQCRSRAQAVTASGATSALAPGLSSTRGR